MKTLAIVTLATVLASPVLAQSYDPDLGTGNIAPLATVSVQPLKKMSAVSDAYAQAVEASAYSRRDDVQFDRAKGNIE